MNKKGAKRQRIEELNQQPLAAQIEAANADRQINDELHLIAKNMLDEFEYLLEISEKLNEGELIGGTRLG